MICVVCVERFDTGKTYYEKTVHHDWSYTLKKWEYVLHSNDNIV